MPKILYVDDDADICEIASFALGLDPDIEVRTSSDGADAVEVARHWRPALIMLDVTMPGLDGPDVVGKLRDCPDTAEIPVVFITARVHPNETANLRALGVVGIIAKPFDPMSFAALVRKYLQ